MQPISSRRFVAAALVAGLIVNVFDGVLYTVVLGPESAATMDRLGLSAPGTTGQILYGVMGFVVGFVAIWLYDGVRARLGNGVGTAVKTALAVWTIAYLTPQLDQTIEGLMSPRMFGIAAAFSLVSMNIVLVSGRWVIRRSAES